MGLPVPVEYPLVPIMYYDGNNPPIVPQVPVMQSVQHIVPTVAAAVANEVASKALANSVRMFTYNLFTVNNWANAQFAEVVQLVCDYIAYNLSKGLARSPEMAIPEAVQTVLTLYSSTLLLQYPDLKAYVNQQVISAAYQNAPQLDDLKKGIHDMYNQRPGSGMPGPGYGHAGHVGGYAHTPMHPVHGQYPAYPQGMHPMHMQPPGGHAYGGHYPHGHMPHGGHPSQHVGHGSGFSHTGGRTMSVGTALAHASHQQSTQAASDRFAARPNRTGVVHHQQHQPAPPAATEKNADAAATSELTIAEGSEMDRAAHQLTYFGNSYQQDLRPRAAMFQQSAQAMSTAVVTQEQQHVHPAWLMTSALDDAITLGRARQYEQQEVKSRSDIFRCFAIVAKPITSTEDIDQVMQRLLEANSFNGLAAKIKAHAQALNQSKGDMGGDPDAIVSFLSTVDNRMTKLVNEFFRVNLGLKGFRLDSFAEDIGAVIDALSGKGAAMVNAYLEFEKEVISVLGGEEFDQDALKAAYDSLDIPEGLKYTTIPENYSITYVFMNSRELGWSVGADPVRINRRTAPTLHRVIESLTEHKKSMGLPTLNDVIVTSDNVTYRIYRDYLRAGEYLISTFA